MNEKEIAELLSSLGIDAKTDDSIVECTTWDHTGHLECAGCSRRTVCPILRHTLIDAIAAHERITA